LSQVLYLAAGAAGLPVFASGMGLQALLGPAGGYLIAFPGVAFIAGVVSRRFSHLSGQLLAAACGVAALYAGGTLWLAVWLGATAIPGGVAPMVRAWQLGVMPFVLVDLAKGVLAALVADRGRGLLSPPARRRDER
jgi:biotin transport system substrate-specific component